MGGVRWVTVIASAANQPASHPGSPIRSGAGTRSSPPTQSGVKTSRSSGSWARPESRLKRSAAARPKVRACQSRKCDSGRWAPTIPLGSPVEPEVKAIQAGASGWTSTQGAPGSGGSPGPSTARRGAPARAAATSAGSGAAPGTSTQARGRARRHHVRQAGRRIGRIEHDEGGARAQHAEQGRRQRGGPMPPDRHRRGGTDPGRQELPGRAAARRVEVSPGPDTVGVDGRRAVGVAPGLVEEPRVDRAVPLRAQRPGGIGQDGRGRGGHQGDVQDPAVRILGHPFQHRPVLAQQLRHARRVEQGGVVDQVDVDRSPPLADVEGEVELRFRLRSRPPLDLQAAQALPLGREVEHVEEDLEHRGAREVPLRLQLGQQGLEGDVLVLVGAERGLPHPVEQLAEARVAAEVGAQGQGVEEEADQPLGLEVAAAGDRRSHHDVVLAGEAREQELEGGEQGHEQARSPLARQRPQGLPHRLRKVEPQAAAVEGLHGRARMVEGQVERSEVSSPVAGAQLVAPVGELRLQGVAGQPLALPAGEVPVLDGERRQRRGLARQEGAIEGDQLAVHHPRGPAVGDDVMDLQHEEVEIGLEPEQRGAEQRAGFQVEGRGQGGARQPLGLGLADRLRQRREVDHRQGNPQARVGPLDGPAVDLAEGDAQRLVAAHHLVQRPLQGSGGQPAAQAQGRAHVEGGVAGLQAVEEPEALLAEGEGRRLAGGPGDERRRRGRGEGTAAVGGGATVVSIQTASAATVGVSKTARSGISTPQLSRTRATSWVASSEWPPSVEEVVVPADLGNPQHLLPEARQGRLAGRPRRLEGAVAGALEVRRRQRRPVDLAVAGQRQGVEERRSRPAPCSPAARPGGRAAASAPGRRRSCPCIGLLA